MKKIIIILVLSVFLFGCDKKVYHWEFKKNISEVAQISIIYIESHIPEADKIINLPPEKIIDKTLVYELLEEVQEMEMKKSFGMEMPFPIGYCFLIDYGNGKDYSILSNKGSGYIYLEDEENRLVSEVSILHFDNEDFKNLMNKYLAL